jgi:hypothetical protein
MEPPSAQHEGLPAADQEALVMHGPDGDGLLTLAAVDGHLKWAGPLGAQISGARA